MKTADFLKTLFLCLVFSQLSNAQNHEYRTVSKQLVNKYYKGYYNYTFPNDSYNLEKSLPGNPNKKATVDYTQKLQDAINKYPVVIMPNFPVLINSNGLTIPSNRKIYFNRYSKVIYRGPAKGRLSDIIKVYNASNVKIYNANIVGSRKEKNDQAGEWSAGICVLNSLNVEIYNFQIKDTWGDGVFVGSEDGKVSSNIVIKNGSIDNARRDGISITSANNLHIDSVFISNTFGTLPMNGIQIEPSLYKETLKDVNLSNIYTFNNPGGFCINLQAFSIKNNPQKEVSITMQNYTDDGSNYSFGTSINDDNSIQNPIGTITIINAVWKNPKKDFYWRNSSKYEVKIVLDKVKKYKNNVLINKEN
ncbi:right-handed parallel beta-helix repeat-containing protein [Flavobacterium sp. CSZ]|uniref:right-handed parallel beta-helix repeat-containing protein n=1 Tax=Flavobacterium sp. CSZ TaxID=2783791 RepID=UPI00188A673B|nr:right-handed parallel beta-helix repeat-containing protein [Flavobacterium sp. CSZ]MBF4486003.1 right-handed parallel beta-helix repeat-containing protein [Flavobacterium sp. CSZ]